MIELKQQTNNLIGSLESIKELEAKEHARILTISDSHGGFQLFCKIIKRYGPDCDGLIFCGDGYSDISNILDLANTDSDFKAAIPPVFAFVKGNCDSNKTFVSFDIRDKVDNDSYTKQTVFLPSKQILTVNNQNILIVHGDRQSVGFGYERLGLEMQLQECRTAVHGHTHVPCDTLINDFKIVNPGSISRPRDGMPPSFAILTVEKNFVDAAFIKINGSSENDDSFELMKSIF